MPNSESHVLLFDGVCNLCNRSVHFIIKRDPEGKFKFASLQSETGQALLKKFGRASNEFYSLVYIHKERVFLKSSAVLHVLKTLGPAWNFFYIFIFLPRPLRDYVYSLIAKTRYRFFGQRAECMVPTDDLKDRFL